MTKLQALGGRVYSDWHNLGRSLTEINRKQQAAARETHFRSKARASCAVLMAAFLLYYGILPRVLLLLIANFQLRLSLRRLRPSLTAPYFAKIVAYLSNPPMGPSPEPALATDGQIGPVGPVDGSLTSPDQKPAKAKPAVTSTEPPEGAPPSSSLAVVFSYEVEVPANGWSDAIPLSAFGEVHDLGNANDRASRTLIISALRGLAVEIRDLVVVVDLIGSPDNQFVTFLQATIGLLPESARSGTVVLLSGGERLRAKFSDDVDRIRTRVLLWREKIAHCGVPEDHIFEFDHHVATAQSRHELRDRLEAIRGNGSGRVRQSSSAIRLAGRFSKAGTLICDAVKMVAGCSDADRFGSETRELHQRIRDLYEQEASLLARAFATVGGTPQSLTPVLTAAGDQASAGIDKLQNGAQTLVQVGRDKAEQAQQWWSHFKGYTAGLSGRWAVAVGLAAALSGSLAGVPAMASLWAFVAGAALGCQVPSLFSSLKQKLLRLLPGAGRGGTGNAAIQVTTDDMCLDDLVRTNVVWALVLELQGNSEEVIAKTLQWLLTDCHPGLIESLGKTQELLHEVEDRLRQLLATAST